MSYLNFVAQLRYLEMFSNPPNAWIICLGCLYSSVLVSNILFALAIIITFYLFANLLYFITLKVHPQFMEAIP
ncbi:hypothetical protein MBOVb_2080 [Mycoplasmopsis bovis 1067]|nr:hypothetical protein MBOVb_2080 [Mycoplasmopsis bovis 1067]